MENGGEKNQTCLRISGVEQYLAFSPNLCGSPAPFGRGQLHPALFSHPPTADLLWAEWI